MSDELHFQVSEPVIGQNIFCAGEYIDCLAMFILFIFHLTISDRSFIKKVKCPWRPFKWSSDLCYYFRAFAILDSQKNKIWGEELFSL
jgi:hypothetical protein